MTCLGVITGAMTSIINPDKTTIDYLKARTAEPFEPLTSDPDAIYAKTFNLDVSNIEPQVVVPPERYTVQPISKVQGTTITRGMVGSCASGRMEDLRIAAKILKNKKIHPDVRLTITPGTVGILKRALSEGLIETFVDAEAIVTDPACGMCFALHTPLASNDVCVASSTNNVPGRMEVGTHTAQIYLASPATVAASCIEGQLADPRTYL
jgi:homoaconitase/3-isopropylmalate dehydratase large subunit